MRGDGVEENKAIATELLRNAAENGYPEAQFRYGWCFYDGFGVTKDKTKAFEWFKKSADQGDPNGQLSVGLT